MEKINVQLSGDQGNYPVITVLEGVALEQKQPEKINISGNIESVANFLSKRYGAFNGFGLQNVDKEKAVVIVDEFEMKIQLLLDPQNYFGTTVMAKLELSEEIKPFCINKDRQFTREEMIKLIRFNKRFFDAEKHESLLNAFLKLNYSVATDVKSENDNRGNKEQAFKRYVKDNSVPESFTLNIPVFKGQPARLFRVDVIFEPSDASFKVWFESTELVDIIENDRKDIFSKQLESCKDFVIIYK